MAEKKTETTGIDQEKVFAVADSLYSDGVKVTVAAVIEELQRRYGSKGNRNLVTKSLQAWRDSKGLGKTKPQTAPKVSAVKSTESDEPAEAFALLPAMIRQPINALIVAIINIIGGIRNEERNAASELIENARREAEQEVEVLRTALATERQKNKQLSDENIELKTQLEQQIEQQTAENAAKLMEQFSQFVRSGACVMSDNNVKATGRADNRKKK